MGNKRNQWIIDLGNNDILWASDPDNIPSMITYSYQMLRNLAREGNVYGVLLQIRDVYEYILRIPTLMALIIIESDPKYKDVKGYDKVVGTMLEAPMSMGRWYDLAGKIKKQNKALELPENLVEVIIKTRALYNTEISDSSTDVVNWRNDTIGHGFLKFEDDIEYQKEVRALISMLNEYFGDSGTNSINDLYSDMFFISGSNVLRGSHFVADFEEKLVMSVAGYEYDVAHYMYKHDIRFFLFDSYYSRKNLMKYNSYLDGMTDIKKDKYFHDLFIKYVLKGKSDSAVNSSYVSNEDEALLEFLHMPINYIKPEGLLKQLENVLEDIERGIITIQMERGTGKSAFSNRMNGLYHKKPLIDDSFVRCYHVQNAALRGTSDFVNVVNDLFTHNYDGSRIVSADDELQSIKINTGNPSQDMANFLNYYHRKHKKEYTILVIDGIDEVSENTKLIMDFVPSQEMLDEGVFVIMTTRFSDEASVGEKSRGFINVALSKSNQTISIRRKDKINLDVLDAFIDSYKKEGLIDDETNTEQLIEKSDYRFLYLKAYLDIKNRASLDTSNESAFIASYMEYITTHYSLIQNQQIKEIAVSIALFPGLSIEKYQEYISSDEITYNFIGLLNDLMPVLTVVHMNGENQYSFADQAYSEYVLTEYKASALKIIQSLLIRIQDLNDKPYDGWLQDDGYNTDNTEYQTLSNQNREQLDVASLLYSAITFIMENGPGSMLFSEQNKGFLGWINRLYYGRFVSPQCEALRYGIIKKTFLLNLACIMHKEDVKLHWMFTLYDYKVEIDLSKILEDRRTSEQVVKTFDVVAASSKSIEDHIESIIKIVARYTIPDFAKIVEKYSLEDIAIDKIWELWRENCALDYVEQDEKKEYEKYGYNDLVLDSNDEHQKKYIDAIFGERTAAIESFNTVDQMWDRLRKYELEKILRFVTFSRAFDENDSISVDNRNRLRVIELITYMFILNDYKKGKACLERINMSEIDSVILMKPIFKDYLMNCAFGEAISTDEFIEEKRASTIGTLISAAIEAVDEHDWPELNAIFDRIEFGGYSYETSEEYDVLVYHLAKAFSGCDVDNKTKLLNTVWDVILIDAIERYSDVMNVNRAKVYKEMWDRYVNGAKSQPEYPDNYEVVAKLLPVLSNAYLSNGEIEKSKHIWLEYTLVFANKCELLKEFFTPKDYEKYRSLFTDNYELYYCGACMNIRLAGLALTNKQGEAKKLMSVLDETNTKLFEIVINNDMFDHSPYEYERYFNHLSRTCKYLGVCMQYGLRPKKSGGKYIHYYEQILLKRLLEILKGIDSTSSYNELKEMVRITLAHSFLSKNYSAGAAACENMIGIIEQKKASDKDLIDTLNKLAAFVEYSAIHFRYLAGENISKEEFISYIKMDTQKRPHYKSVSLSDAFYECDYLNSHISFARDCANNELKGSKEYAHKILVPTEAKVMSYENRLF